MSRRLLAAALLTGSSLTATAQTTQEPPRRIAASSFATVEVHLNSRPIGRRWYEEDAALTGPARIAISYSQPHARGRQIIGTLIPNDTVWRFGANAATTLHTDLDLTIGTLAVPRGDYSLFVKHSGAAWQLIINRQTAQWGTDYQSSYDLGRVALTAKETKDNEETFTIYLVPSSKDPASGYATLDGLLRIRWGTTELSVPWTVKQ